MTFTQQVAASFSFEITPNIYKYSICGCMVTVNLLQKDLEKRNASTLFGWAVQDARPFSCDRHALVVLK